MNSDCAVRSCSLSLQNPSRKAQSVHAKKSPGFTDAHDSLRLLRSHNQQIPLDPPPPTSCLSTFFDPSLIFWIYYRTWSSAVIGIGTIGWNKILPHQREARSTADIGSLGTVSSLTRLLVLASQIGLVGAEGPSTALDVSPIDVSIGLGGSRTERSIP